MTTKQIPGSIYAPDGSLYATLTDGAGNLVTVGGGGGSGTVTSVSVTTANGVSGTVATPTVTPAISLTLGAITPTSVAIGAGSAITSSGPGGALASGAYATAYSLPTASTSVLGGVKVDGSTITISGGIISSSGGGGWGTVGTSTISGGANNAILFQNSSGSTLNATSSFTWSGTQLRTVSGSNTGIGITTTSSSSIAELFLVNDVNQGGVVSVQGSAGFNTNLQNQNLSMVVASGNASAAANGLFLGSNGANCNVTIYAGGSVIGTNEVFTLSGTNQTVQFKSANSFSANSTTATLLGSLGPAGSHTTVQTWLTIVDNGGTTRYIPCF